MTFSTSDSQNCLKFETFQIHIVSTSPLLEGGYQGSKRGVTTIGLRNGGGGGGGGQ